MERASRSSSHGTGDPVVGGAPAESTGGSTASDATSRIACMVA
jgi:hypothetical protein